MAESKESEVRNSSMRVCLDDATLSGWNAHNPCAWHSIADPSLADEEVNSYRDRGELLAAGFQEAIKKEGAEFRAHFRDSTIARKKALGERLALATPGVEARTRRVCGGGFKTARAIAPLTRSAFAHASILSDSLIVRKSAD